MKRRAPKVKKVYNGRLKGKTVLKRDRAHKALLPGKRISKNGNTYYEYRKNHSDRHGKRR